LLKPAAATPATPPASVPTATASFNLPQPPVSAPMNSAVGTVPAAPLNAPATSAPSGSLPLLSQLGLPSNLAGLNGLPLPNVAAPAAAPAAPAPGDAALPPSLNPFSALP
jgi:hypothetical protein